MLASEQFGIAERIELLRAIPVLAELESELLADLAAELETVSLPAGSWLFRAGEPASAVYLLAAGRLEVVAERPDRVISILRRGAVIGELAVLLGGSRSASVRACRNSTLLVLGGEAFATTMQKSPAFGLTMVRTLAAQLSMNASSGPIAPPTTTIAVVALDHGVDARAAARALTSALGRPDQVARCEGPPSAHDDDWLHRLQELEAAHDRVVLVAPAGRPGEPWSDFCLGQADLVVALADRQPASGWFTGGREAALRAAELLCVDMPVRESLIDRLQPSHVRAVSGPGGASGAMRELGRRLTGKGVGVVLSGGGARAFAHLGAIEGLRAAGIEIERIGGVSLGAVIGAAIARGDEIDALHAGIDHYFVNQNPTNDYTLPLSSVLRGGKTARMLAEGYGDVCIEELQTPFFCTSTDLVRREAVVHRSGRVAEAVLASLSIPGVFPPVSDRHGRLLVDGGVLDNLPVRAMRESGGGPIVAVDVTGAAPGAPRPVPTAQGTPWKSVLRRAVTGTRKPLPPITDTIVRCMLLASADTVAAGHSGATLVIKPQVSGIGLLEWKRLPEMRAAGATATREALAANSEAAELLQAACA